MVTLCCACVQVWLIVFALWVQIREDVTRLPKLAADQVTELSAEARDFLLGLAHSAYNESERPAHENDSGGETKSHLTWDALHSILSVIPADVVHPWSQPPAFLVSVPRL